MKILIPAYQRDATYADLQVLIVSLKGYAPDVPIIVAYKGDKRPPVFCDVVKQPDSCAHFGDACRFLIEQAGPEDDTLLFLNDDTVITPDTLPKLVEDITAIDKTEHPEKKPRGIVGLRSNFIVWGPQNIRWTGEAVLPPGTPVLNGSMSFSVEQAIVPINQIFGVAFAIDRETLRVAGDDWTRTHWYGDNLLSWDLLNKGYGHYVSRAYVHHIGSRSGGSEKWPEWDKTAREYLVQHRPDFARHMRWIG